MGRELGRISGALLADNIKRNGQNLAFDTKVLYLDVTNNRVGFNTSTPVNDLYTPTAINSTNWIVDATADIGNFIVSGSTIQHVLGNNITISPNQINPKISTPGLSTANLYAYTNTISSTTTNSNINLTPNGSGGVNLNTNVLVNGTLHATGNITFDGSIQFGDSTSDRITFAADVTSSIIPLTTNTYDLGSSSLQWNNIYTYYSNIPGTINLSSNANSVTATLNVGNITVNGNTITNIDGVNSILFQGNGTGTIKFNSVNYIKGSNIYIPLVGNYTISSTSQGYVKFAGTKAITIPSGPTVKRDTIPEIGEIRYNTDLGYGEVYSGTSWQPVGGTSSSLTIAQIQDLSTLYSIIFGL